VEWKVTESEGREGIFSQRTIICCSVEKTKFKYLPIWCISPWFYLWERMDCLLHRVPVPGRVNTMSRRNQASYAIKPLCSGTAKIGQNSEI
jgi:hypothetical protein